MTSVNEPTRCADCHQELTDDGVRRDLDRKRAGNAPTYTVKLPSGQVRCGACDCRRLGGF